MMKIWNRLAGAAGVVLAIAVFAAFGSGIAVAADTVSTFAGTGAHSSQNGPGNTATFQFPKSVAVDSLGNVFVAEYGAHLIRKITPAGVVSTFAGTGTLGHVDGPGNTAQFSAPQAVAVDGADNVYVVDAANRIRKITPAAVVSTFAGSGTAGGADGNGAAASFRGPLGLAADSAGNVYVADTQNNRIRKITPARDVSTLAGPLTGASGHVNGSASAARFNSPQGVAVDSTGNVYVGDINNYAVRRISPTGTVSTLAGSLSGVSGQADGLGNAATLAIPWGMTVDSADNLYVADNQRIRKITPLGQVTTVAGSSIGYLDGPALSAQFVGALASVAIHRPSGIVYIADYANDRIRALTLEAAAQQTQNEYAAKVICGVSAPTAAIPVPPVAQGAYFTALNVRNAAGQANDLKWRIAIALPGEKAGPVSQFFVPVALQRDEALEIDCPDIGKRLGKKPDEFVKGFVVIQSNLELDVVAVYTTAAILTGTVSSMHTERVPKRAK